MRYWRPWRRFLIRLSKMVRRWTRLEDRILNYLYPSYAMVHFKGDEGDYDVEDERPTLPITIALNHAALGMGEHTVCEACARDEHWDCCLATWCTCDDPTDGDKEAGLYDPYWDEM